MIDCRHMTQVRPVTIAVLNYNGGDIVLETIRSALNLEYPAKQLLMVDDGSSDGSVEQVRRLFPQVRIIEMGRNTKRLNAVRNRALAAAETDLVLITDNDICFERDCLLRMTDTLQAHPSTAVVTPRVMYADERDRIYIDRNRIHFVGACSDLNRERRLGDIKGDTAPARTFGCGIMLVDKSRLGGINGFDDAYIMGWGDDGEFHHRLNLAGRPVFAVPQAMVYHKAIKGAPRIRGQVRNRWSLILQTYSGRSLLVLAPALLVYELSLLVYVVSQGAVRQYLRGCGDVLRDLRHIWRRRLEVQRQRVVSDRELLEAERMYVPPRHLSNRPVRWGLRGLDVFLRAYWSLARHLL